MKTLQGWILGAAMLATPASTSLLDAQEGTSSATVGEPAPDFELMDAEGNKHRLSDYQGKNHVVLEFFRSGDW